MGCGADVLLFVPTPARSAGRPLAPNHNSSVYTEQDVTRLKHGNGQVAHNTLASRDLRD